MVCISNKIQNTKYNLYSIKPSIKKNFFYYFYIYKLLDILENIPFDCFLFFIIIIIILILI